MSKDKEVKKKSKSKKKAVLITSTFALIGATSLVKILNRKKR